MARSYNTNQGSGDKNDTSRKIYMKTLKSWFERISIAKTEFLILENHHKRNHMETLSGHSWSILLLKIKF